jgi:hypothetical protein
MFPPVFSRNGADWRIGRRVAELFRAAGLVDVQVEARAEVYPKGHTRRTICVDLIRSMRPQVLELGLVTEEELERLFAEALAHLDDTATVWCRTCSSWYPVASRIRSSSNVIGLPPW